MNKIKLPYTGWLLAISFIMLTFLPRSLNKFMFVDGMIYAAISRNMAMGKGTFWEPYFLQTSWPTYNNCAFFCDHPPLMFALESALFFLFNDQAWVEDFYNLLILIALVLLLVLLWRKFYKESPEIVSFAWLPVLCWYAIRTVWWSMPNNLLDTTMGVFCLLASLSQLFAMTTTSSTRRLSFWVLASTFLLLAFLTKGPVGLYPLAFAAIYAIVYGSTTYSTAIKGSIIMLGTFVTEMALLVSYRPAYVFITQYFEGQVIQSLLNKRESLGNTWSAHFFIIRNLALDLLPHVLILIGLYLLTVNVRKTISHSLVSKKVGWICLFVALSGILPMLISSKQGVTYMMPALPFLGLFFASLYIDRILYLANRHQVLSTGATLFLAVACWAGTIYTFKTSENRHFHFSLEGIDKVVPRGIEIGVSQQFYHNSNSPAYLQRNFELSPNTDWSKVEYILTDTTCSDQLKAMAITNPEMIWKNSSGEFTLYKISKKKNTFIATK